jgi:hypothetical protein
MSVLRRTIICPFERTAWKTIWTVRWWPGKSGTHDWLVVDIELSVRVSNLVFWGLDDRTILW